jgi:hypothetical protein
MTLKMYDDGHDWVIAENPEDAMKVYSEAIGSPVESEDEWCWEELPPEKSLKFWMDAAGNVSEPGVRGATLVSSTVTELIAKFGRSYVGSRDY